MEVTIQQSTRVFHSAGSWLSIDSPRYTIDHSEVVPPADAISALDRLDSSEVVIQQPTRVSHSSSTSSSLSIDSLKYEEIAISQPIRAPPPVYTPTCSPKDMKPHPGDPIRDHSDAPSKDEETTIPREPFITHPTTAWYYVSHILPLVASVLLLAWPWAFFAVVWSRHGIAPTSPVLILMTKHHQSVTFLTAYIGTLHGMLVVAFFSLAILRVFRKWVVRARGSVDVYSLAFFMGLLHQDFPWEITRSPSRSRKHAMGLIAITCAVVFKFVPSSVSALTAPTLFNKTHILNGTELDFTSITTPCLEMWKESLVETNCSRVPMNYLGPKMCLGERVLIGALESGLDDIFWHSIGRPRSMLLNGTLVSGPLRGVFPIDLDRSPDVMVLKSQNRPYQYTFELQGVRSSVSCQHNDETPIRFMDQQDEKFANLPNNTGAISGSCVSGHDILPNVTNMVSIIGEKTLGFWACKNPADGSSGSYILYFAGSGDYSSVVGNISCIFSTMPAIYPVTFTQQTGAFSSSSAQDSNISPTPYPSDLVMMWISWLRLLVAEAQSYSGNLIAESARSTMVEWHSSQSSEDGDGDEEGPVNLKLFEIMIQGIVEYQVTYTRMIYRRWMLSKSEEYRSSCQRTVHGSGISEILGWSFTKKTIVFLMAPTVVSLITVVLLIVGMTTGERTLYSMDPTNIRSLLRSTGVLQENSNVVRIAIEEGTMAIKMPFRPVR